MGDGTNLDAAVSSVTVFGDAARVLRRGTVALEPGTRHLVIDDLPGTVEPASVRVVVRGSNVALLDVEIHRRYRADPLREETGRYRADVERCRDAVQALDDEDAAEGARLDFMGHLSLAAATSLARAVSFGRADRVELSQMADQLAAATATALTSRRHIDARRRAARLELEAAEQRLASAEQWGEGSVEMVEVGATLEVSAAAEPTVEVSYHVSGASWRPLYDLRVDGEQLVVSYLAEVTQQSGEDWPLTELTLSTTRRGRHRGLPELRPWYIGKEEPHIRLARAPAAPPPAPVKGMPMAAAAMVPEAEPLVAERGESGAALVYRLPRPLAVPSDGGPHKTTIARLELVPVLDHVTIPALAPEAYLRATVTNSSTLLLLPGPANVFHEAEYVGATSLETVAPGEEFELQLGVDDRIRVKRELRRRSTGKTMLGGTRSIDIAYEITVENHRDRVARVSVHDHIPLSRDGDVKVRLRETNPKPNEQDELGELTWELTLDPGQEATVVFAFTVEHPAGVTVFGL